MIVITGPGRTGTSLLARIYRDAGMDPGGIWEPDVSAGFEDPDICDLNARIMSALGVSLLGGRRPTPDLATVVNPQVAHFAKRVIPGPTRTRLRQAFDNRKTNRLKHAPEFPWSALAHVVSRYSGELHDAISGRRIAKDPQFSWTLPVWLAAGARPSHVIATSRRIDDIVASRTSAGHLRYATESAARNAMVYTVGLLQTTLADADVPCTWLRFPDFAERPQALAEELPRPDGLTSSAWAAVVRAAIDPSQIHAYAPRGRQT